MKFYYLPQSYFGQIEAWSLFGVRFGFTAFGLALWPPRGRRMPWWAPHVRFEFWSHTGQCDQRWLFRIVLGRLRVGYKTRGDATPDLAAYRDAGFRIGA